MEDRKVESIDEVDAHYREHIGSDVNYVRFLPPDRGLIGVLEWPPGSSRLKVHFYATLGLHALINDGADPKHGFELFTGVKKGSNAFRRAFALMANDLVSEQITVGAGHIVSQDQGPIIEGLPFSSWLMLERFDDLIPTMRLQNGDHIAFLDATPIFQEEADCVRTHGLEALFEVWANEKTRPSDLNRGIPAALR